MPTFTAANREKAIPAATPSPRRVADVIVEQLRLWGVKRIYGVVGDAIFGLLDAVARQDDIRFISVKHESVAALMASAEAKLTGGLGVCAAQMGPGLANLTVGLGDAFLDSAPVLVITGQAPTDKIGTPYKQFVNQQEMVQAVSRFSELVVHPDAVPTGLAAAMYKSLAERSVSHLSVPANLFLSAATSDPRKPPRLPAPTCGRELPEQALEWVRSAKRPMMLVGGRVRLDRARLLNIAERWGCGIAMSYGAVGIVPDSHPLMLNGLGEGGNPLLPELFRESDVVLALETDWWPTDAVPRQACLIQWASRLELFGLSLPAEIGLIGDFDSFADRIIDGLKSHAANPSWLERIGRCKRDWSIRNEQEGDHSQTPLHPSSIVRAIERHVDEDAVIAMDEGDSTLWFLRNFRGKRQRVLLSERWRTMGFGLPAAMAAKLCEPDKQVVCLTGDGGLGMVLADLSTAARYGLAIVVILFENGTLQMETDKMLMKGLEPAGTALTNPDFARVAEACGWIGLRVESVEQLNEALRRSRSSVKPVLLSVRTAQVPFPDFANNM
jgi:pyruvate dehydrogenase (quinone)/pyruvate oxidase